MAEYRTSRNQYGYWLAEVRRWWWPTWVAIETPHGISGSYNWHRTKQDAIKGCEWHVTRDAEYLGQYTDAAHRPADTAGSP